LLRQYDKTGTFAAGSGSFRHRHDFAADVTMRACRPAQSRGLFMNNIIYIVGLIVVVLAILSFLGLR
jgi:small-conductance mechanosensitive channel